MSDDLCGKKGNKRWGEQEKGKREYRHASAADHMTAKSMVRSQHMMQNGDSDENDWRSGSDGPPGGRKHG